MNAPVFTSVLSHLSASSIGTFLRCPRQFRLKYIDHIEPSFRASALAFGSAWHTVLGHYLATKDNKKPIDELHELFVSAFDQQINHDGPPVLYDEGKDYDGLVALGKKMLEVFIERVPLPDRVLEIELPFSVDLIDPETGKVLPPHVGSIDALVINHDITTVWEFKSGKKKWAADQLAYELQPTAYRIGMRAHGIENVELELLVTTKSKVPDVQIERLIRGRQEERDLIATAASVVRAVDAGVDHPMRGWLCRGCAVAGACR